MIAAFKLRAVPINVNYRYVEDELRYLLDDADVRAVVFHREFAPKLAAIQRRRSRSCSTYLAVDDGTRRRARAPRRARLRVGALRREPGAQLRPALRRRSLHPLHGRHHRHAQGRHVAPRRRVLRRARRRRRRRSARSPLPRRSPNVASQSRTRCVPACPFMHGTAHWMAFSALFTGGTVVIPAEHQLDALKLWQLVEREHANFMVIVGDAFARPMLDALDTDAGRAIDVSGLRVLLSGGAILSPTLKRELVARLPGMLVVDGYGASETGGQGQSVVVSGGEIPSAPQFRVSDDTHRARRRPAAGPGRRDRAPRAPRTDSARLLQGSREDGGHVPGRRRCALGRARRPRGRRRRRPDHAARPRLGLDQHRRREGLSRRGRVGPEGPRRRHRRGRGGSTRRTMGRTGRRGRASAARHRTVARIAPSSRARAPRAATRCPASIVFVDAITRSPSGKPDYRWAKATALEAAEAASSREDRSMTNRLDAETSPVSSPAPRQPGRLVPVG